MGTKNKLLLSPAMKALERDARFAGFLKDPNLNAYLRFHALRGFIKCCIVEIQDHVELQE
jgi:hypothetical protein